MRNIAPVRPGRILADQCLADLGLSQRVLAELLDVPPWRINQIVHGQRAITPDTSLRLGTLFSQSDTYWLNLQKHYDIEVARATVDLSRVHVLASQRGARSRHGERGPAPGASPQARPTSDCPPTRERSSARRGARRRLVGRVKPLPKSVWRCSRGTPDA